MAKVDKNGVYPRNLLDTVFEGWDKKYSYDENEFLEYAFSKLTDMQKAVILLRFRDKQSMRCVAESMQRNIESIRRSENKALRIIKTCGVIISSMDHPKDPRNFTLNMIAKDLSVRSINNLKRAFQYEEHSRISEITVGDIVKKFEDGSIKDVRNLSVVSYNEILSVIKSLNIDVTTRDECIHQKNLSLLEDKSMDASISILELPNDIYNPLYRTGKSFTIGELIKIVNNYPDIKIYGIGDMKIKRLRKILKEKELIV